MIRNALVSTLAALAMLPQIVHAQGPDPAIDIRITPEEVRPGASFRIEVTGTNRGANARNGSITVSFPSNPSITILDSDATRSRPGSHQAIIRPGESVFNSQLSRSVAEYTLGEAYFEGGWANGERHYIQIEVYPALDEPSVLVQARVTLRGTDGRFVTAPGSSSIEDQQGFPVLTRSVRVLIPTPTPAPSPTPEHTAVPTPTLAPTATPEPSSLPNQVAPAPIGGQPTPATGGGGSDAGPILGLGLILAVAAAFGVAIVATRPRRPVTPGAYPGTQPGSGPHPGSPAWPPPPPAVSQPPIPQPSRLPTGFQALEVIGSGGMATVYKAFQPSLARSVALKVLASNLANDPDFVQRFMGEARTAAMLEHPSIVTIYDVGQTDQGFYIAMRLIAGRSLDTVLREEGALSPSRAVYIVAQIAEALDYAHSRGVVHRDIKPANIMVEAADRAILTDFGIAKALEGTRLTRTGAVVGTPEYMAPEQARGEEVDYRVDLYALGIVLFELLCGRVPFQADTGWGVLNAQINTPPPTISHVRPGVPAPFDAVMFRALAKDRNTRYGSGREFVVAAGTALGLGSWPFWGPVR